jgi:tetratricopeptide (TPR) repeat protein
MSARGISDLERGVRSTPQRDTVEQLAEALELSPDDRLQFQAASRRPAGSFSPVFPVSPHRSRPDTLSAPPFVGREQDLGILQRHVAGNGAPLLVLAGEPGIGKTRLLEEAGKYARDRGLAVLQGGCQRRTAQDPYAPLLAALARSTRRQSRPQLRTALRGCSWLARLLPELTEIVGDTLPTLLPEQERRLMFEAVARFLANLGGPAGTFLVLDDLQWAGEDALELLSWLTQSARDIDLRVVGAYRTTEISPESALAVTLADLATAQLATQRILNPLSHDEAVGLLARFLPDAGTNVLDLIVGRTGGVPFFLMNYAQEVHASGPASPDVHVPWNLAQSLRQRVAALPQEAQDVLAAGAVIGRIIPYSLLTAVVDRPEEHIVSGLEAAHRARLLLEGEQAYQFAHDIVREVVQADLGMARRILLHRRVAEALERESAAESVEALVFHYLLSGNREKAIQYLEQAGDQARAQYANEAAASHYRGLVARLEEQGQESGRAREKLGAVLTAAGGYDEALEALEPAARVYAAADDVEALGRITAEIARVHLARGTVQEGKVRIQGVLERLEAHGPSSALASLYAALASLFSQKGEYAEQLATAERAAELARIVGGDRILVEAEVGRGIALQKLGRLDESLQVIEAAIPLAESSGDLTILCRALTTASDDFRTRGEFGRSKAYYERALEVAERIGDPAIIADATYRLGYTAYLLGDWKRARAYDEEMVSLSRPLGTSRISWYPLVALGAFSLYAGEWDEALRHLQEALSAGVETQDLELIRRSQRLLAELDILEGRPETARGRLEPLLDRPGVGEEEDVMYLLPLLSWAYLALGDLERACRIADDAVRRATSEKRRLYLVEALRVQAMAAIRQKRCRDAARILEEGLSLARSMPYPYGEARLLYEYGMMQTQERNIQQAGERLEEALAIFSRLGAKKDLERTQQALAAVRRASTKNNSVSEPT